MCPLDDVLLDRGGAVYNVQSGLFGPTGTGIGSDGTQLYSILNTVPAPASFVVSRRTYDFNVPGTIPAGAALKLENGAVFRPARDVTITINAELEAGDWQCFDFSLGGSIILSSKSVINPMWFGVVGDNSIDEVTALNHLIASIPDYSTVEFPGGITLRLDSTWTIAGRQGIEFRSRVSPFPDGAGSTKFTWGGGAGGTLIKVSSCDTVEFKRFYLDLGSRGGSNSYADIGIDCDDNGVNGVTGTHCRFSDVIINGTQSPATTWYGFRLSKTSGNNQEYHQLKGCRVFGTGFVQAENVTGTIPSGSLNVATLSGRIPTLPVGAQYRVRIDGAGAGSASALLDTTLTVTSSSQGMTVGTLTIAASRPVTAAHASLGQAYGHGVNIGPSANAKGQWIEGCSFVNLARGIWMENGSYYSHKNNFAGCEVNHWLDSGTEPMVDRYSNCEQSRQHLVVTNNFGITVMLESCRFGNQELQGDKGWIQLNSGLDFIILNSQFDAPPRMSTGSTIYDFTGFAGRFTAIGNRYTGNPTAQQVGYLGVDNRPISPYYPMVILGDSGLTGMPGAINFWGGLAGSTNAYGTDVAGAHVSTVQTGAGTLPKHIAAVAKAIIRAASNTSDVLVGHQATVVKDAGGAARYDHKMHMYEALLPIQNTDGYTAAELHGFHVVAPVITGGGTSSPVGLYIEDLRSGGTGSIGKSYGIQQIGTADLNLLAGRNFLGTPNSPPVDGDIASAQMSLYLDESSNTMKVRVKYSDGSTLKTGTIALA